MCAVSAVGDDWTRKFNALPDDWYMPKVAIPENSTSFRLGELERKYSELLAMVLTMKAELSAARAQDIANDEPDCEMEEKVVLLKKIAELVGVDLKEVFPDG